MTSILAEVLKFVLKLVPENFRPSLKSLTIFVVALMLGGLVVMAYSQAILPSLRNELDSLHRADSLAAVKNIDQDSAMLDLRKSWDTANAYELSKSPMLSEEEQANVMTLLMWNVRVDVDSLQRLVMGRELMQMKKGVRR